MSLDRFVLDDVTKLRFLLRFFHLTKICLEQWFYSLDVDLSKELTAPRKLVLEPKVEAPTQVRLTVLNFQSRIIL